VYAAPWDLALICKLDRLKGGNGTSRTRRHSYDLDDAVAYLHQIVSKRPDGIVHANELQGWAEEFGIPVPEDSLIDRLQKAYGQKYQAHVIL
jgi:hypothetical protein